jgi:hypothetical protein
MQMTRPLLSTLLHCALRREEFGALHIRRVVIVLLTREI